ncbi:hypothetical protein JST97_20055 [bacterium]|nr:hypothetical protein [bacterium]
MSQADLEKLHADMLLVRDTAFSLTVFTFIASRPQSDRTTFAKVASKIDDLTERVETLLLGQILAVLQANETGLSAATKDAREKLEALQDSVAIIVSLTNFLNVVTAAFKFVLV